MTELLKNLLIKKLLKVGRIKYYEPNSRIFRTSRGIKRPIEYKTTAGAILSKILKSKLIYEKTIALNKDYNDRFFTCFVNTRVYNTKPRKDKMDLNAEKHLNPF